MTPPYSFFTENNLGNNDNLFSVKEVAPFIFEIVAEVKPDLLVRSRVTSPSGMPCHATRAGQQLRSSELCPAGYITSRLGGRLRFINSTGSVNAGMSNGYQYIY